MSNHFWFGGKEEQYRVSNSVRIDDSNLNRTPTDEDPHEYGQTSDIISEVDTTVGAVESLFSTFLYEGSGTARTSTNGIDLAGEGGMVWVKCRDLTRGNLICDTERGADKDLYTNSSSSEIIDPVNGHVTAFNSDGLDLGNGSDVNANTYNFASWTFRKEPGFFDVVTYTGDGEPGRTVAHNLGSKPGMIWVKRLNGNSEWEVYHRSLGAQYQLVLDQNNNKGSSSTRWDDTEPTDSVFTLGVKNTVNGSSDSYVAYLFAHDDARFGPNSDESIIKCGTYTGNGSTTGPVIDLGWEPQWVIIKNTTSTGNWAVFDTARGIHFDSADKEILANTTGAESEPVTLNLTPTGFTLKSNTGNTSSNNDVYV